VYEYRHGVAAYLPLVTGAKSPFNDQSSEMARYYHSLGLYFPCQIGNAKVLLFKSGLHFAYDGPATPVKKLMTEMRWLSVPKFLSPLEQPEPSGRTSCWRISSWGSVRFDCTTQFKNEPWHDAAFTLHRYRRGVDRNDSCFTSGQCIACAQLAKHSEDMERRDRCHRDHR